MAWETAQIKGLLDYLNRIWKQMIESKTQTSVSINGYRDYRLY